MSKQNRKKNLKGRQKVKSMPIGTGTTITATQNPSVASQINDVTSYGKHTVWLSWVLYWMSGTLTTIYASSTAYIAFINTFVLLNTPAELCSTWPCTLDLISAIIFLVLLLFSSWLLFVRLPQYLVQRETFNPVERITAAIILFLNTNFVFVCRVALFQTFLRIANVTPTAKISDSAYYIITAIAAIWCALLTLRYVTRIRDTPKSDPSFRAFTNTSKQKYIIYNKISRELSEDKIAEMERLLYKTQNWHLFSIDNLIKITFGSLVVALFYAILEELITRL